MKIKSILIGISLVLTFVSGVSEFLAEGQKKVLILQNYIPSTLLTEYYVYGQSVEKHPALQQIMNISLPCLSNITSVLYQQDKILLGIICSNFYKEYSLIGNIFVEQYEINVSKNNYQSIQFVNSTTIIIWGTKQFMIVKHEKNGTQVYRQQLQSQIIQCNCEKQALCFTSSAIIIPSIPLQIYKLQNFIIGASLINNQLLICKSNSSCEEYFLQNGTINLIRQQSLPFPTIKLMKKKENLIYIANNAQEIYILEWNNELKNKYYIKLTVDPIQITPSSTYIAITYSKNNKNSIIFMQIENQQSVYHPLNTQKISNYVLFIPNKKIILVDGSKLSINNNNLEYVMIYYQKQIRNIVIEGKQKNQSQNISITIVPVAENAITPYYPLPQSKNISNNQQFLIQLTKIFVGTNIAYYKIQIDVPALDINHKSWMYLQDEVLIISLYINQYCVGINKLTDISFYRVVRADNKHLLEECSINTIGYICKLLSIEPIDPNSHGLFIMDGALYQINKNGYKYKYTLNSQYNKNGYTLNSQYQQPEQKNGENEKLYDKWYSIIIGKIVKWINLETQQIYEYKHQQINQFCFSKINEVDGYILCEKVVILVKNFKESLRQIEVINLQNMDYVGGYAQQLIVGNESEINKFSTVMSPPILMYTKIVNYPPILKYTLIQSYIIISCINQYHILSIKDNFNSLQLSQGQVSILDSPIQLGSNFIIAIQNSTRFIKHVLSPILSVGPYQFQPFHYQVDAFIKVSTHTFQSKEEVSQKGSFRILFKYLELNYAKTKPNILNVPYSGELQLIIQQNMFYGPIFNYFLSDTFDDQITLKRYIQKHQCPTFMEGSNIISNLLPFSSEYFIIKQNQLISTFVRSEQYFQLLGSYQINYIQSTCKHYTDADGSIIFCPNNLTVLYPATSQFQVINIELSNKWAIKYQLSYKIVYVLQQTNSTKVTIYNVSMNRILKQYLFLNERVFDIAIESLSCIEDMILILGSDGKVLITDLQLKDKVVIDILKDLPQQYSYSYEYNYILGYQKLIQNNISEVKFILTSQNSLDLHLGISLKWDNNLKQTTQIQLINKYSSYPQLICRGVRAIHKISQLPYQYLVLQFFSIQDNITYLAFYPYNIQSQQNPTIQAIQNTIKFEQENTPLQISHLPYSIFTSNLCFQLNTSLYLVLNYTIPPPLTYLIIHAQNIVSSLIFYTKLKFNHEQESYLAMIICFASVLMFVIILIIINRFNLWKSELISQKITLQQQLLTQNSLDDHNEPKSLKSQ